MRKLLFCGAAAAVYLCTAGAAMTAATAIAGGLDEREGSLKDTYVPEPAPLWSGCYFGGNVGAAWTDDNDFGHLKKSHHEYSSKDSAHDELKEYKQKGDEKWKEDHGHDFWKKVPSDKFHFDDETDDFGPFGGVHAGCNWERDRFVFGVEGDIGTGHDIDYLASLRGRIGAAWDSSLIYLTAGVAFIGLDRDFHFNHDHWGKFEIDRRFDESSDETGWVIGAGYERLIDTNLSFGIEGLYYWFDDDNGKHVWVDGDDYHKDFHAFKFDRDVDNDVFVLRARLTYYLRRQPEPLK